MPEPNPPIALLAELTHRCPLMCPYCSNPLELVQKQQELTTDTWSRVFREAADIGVLQLHLSGGEPASRRDIVELTAAAHAAGLYTNLITSGIGLTQARLAALVNAGLDHVQLSLQGARPEMADRIGGYKGGYDRKMSVAELVTDAGLPLTLNAVMHRQNLADLGQTLDLALSMGARRIEVACVQFHGWATRNRASLLPTESQVQQLKKDIAIARDTYRNRMAIDFVPPDYYSDFPKACMGGWGSTGLVVSPAGQVMPCHAADSIPGLAFESVADRHLGEIWRSSHAFNAYRGTDWLPQPCQSCERRDVDFGGCRCQAAALAADPGATDPVCRKSPYRPKVDAMIEDMTSRASASDLTYRKFG